MTVDVSCPACESRAFDESFDVIDGFCENCGVVIPDVNEMDALPEFPEHRPGDEADNPENGVISWSEWYSVTNSTEQQVATAFESLELIADSLGLSTETRVRAGELYCDASIASVTDGRPTDATVASLLYLSSRETEEPRPASAFIRVIERDDAEIKTLARSFQRELQLELPIPEPVDFLPYLAAELGYDEDTVQRARYVLDAISEAGLATGKNPVGIAGATLYWFSQESHSQREIAQVAGVTKETIRKRLNDLSDHLDNREVHPQEMMDDE